MRSEGASGMGEGALARVASAAGAQVPLAYDAHAVRHALVGEGARGIVRPDFHGRRHVRTPRHTTVAFGLGASILIRRRTATNRCW
jgi:hypothetical protein